MSNIAVIPARGGSKRLGNKNKIQFNGLPLIAHSIKYAKENSSIIDEVYVTTDDSEIKSIAKEFGAKVIDRPSSLSQDNSTTVSALKHVLQNVNNKIENLILLQATNPLRPHNLLKTAYSKYIGGNYDSLMTVSMSDKKLGKIVDEKFIPFNYSMGQRSQDLEPLYFENGLLYITKASLILNDIILGENNYPLAINHPYASVDIDTENDLKYAQFILKNYLDEQ